jgi:hypothetical protein
VVTPIDNGGVLEGFVDLVYEDDDGLVIVDYKTDRSPRRRPGGHRRTTGSRWPPTPSPWRHRRGAGSIAVSSSSSLTVSPGSTFEGDDLAGGHGRGAAQVADALVAP